ncbi:MAG: cytidylate kinase [Bdellovibrionales bacterium RBG_16_40_8]|nr:MAG: cytidylate kinase [Bdellovibrionales bacterium RBG_16_40_8]
MKSAPIIITIDGPVASGKTSASRRIAEIHGWAWVSTGAFYRGLAYVAKREAISLDDEDALSKLCASEIWEVRTSSERTKIYLREEDVTAEIYSEEIGAAASLVSRYPKVRENLLAAQRQCAVGVKGLVAEGRDCGTVVFPHAAVKIYLTAGSESRAERRAKEEGKNIEETMNSQQLRDRQDSTRKAAPMQIPAEAHVIDSSSHNLNEVVELINKLVMKELEL